MVHELLLLYPDGHPGARILRPPPGLIPVLQTLVGVPLNSLLPPEINPATALLVPLVQTPSL